MSTETFSTSFVIRGGSTEIGGVDPKDGDIAEERSGITTFGVKTGRHTPHFGVNAHVTFG